MWCATELVAAKWIDHVACTVGETAGLSLSARRAGTLRGAAQLIHTAECVSIHTRAIFETAGFHAAALGPVAIVGTTKVVAVSQGGHDAGLIKTGTTGR